MIFKPVTVHTAVVVDVRTTVSPELAVAPEANGVRVNVFGPGLAKVIVWLPPTTVNVKLCVPAGATPLVAVIVKVDTPVAIAVPESTPAEDRLMPAGSVPAVTANVGAGEPDAVTLKVPKLPAVNVVDAALVMVGAELSVNVNVGETSPGAPVGAEQSSAPLSKPTTIGTSDMM